MIKYEKPTLEVIFYKGLDVITLSANQRDVTGADVDWNADYFSQN